MNEDDIANLMRQDFVFTGSDGSSGICDVAGPVVRRRASAGEKTPGDGAPGAGLERAHAR